MGLDWALFQQTEESMKEVELISIDSCWRAEKTDLNNSDPKIKINNSFARQLDTNLLNSQFAMKRGFNIYLGSKQMTWVMPMT